MHTAEIIIYVIVGILGSLLFVSLAVYNIRNERKHDMNYQKYVESIQIGDTFGHNSSKLSDVNNPFSEDYNASGFDPFYEATIVDIKKNHKGETWVKWCFTRKLNEPHCEWTDEINSFLRYRTRISKRIDNINTNE